MCKLSFGLVMVASLCLCLQASAADGPIGWASYNDLGLNGTTGGAGGETVIVTTGVKACHDSVYFNTFLWSYTVGLYWNADPVHPSSGELCDLDTSWIFADSGSPGERDPGTYGSHT